MGLDKKGKSGKAKKARRARGPLSGLRSSPPRVEDLSESIAVMDELGEEYLHGEWLRQSLEIGTAEKNKAHVQRSWLYLLRLAMEACESGDTAALEEYLR